VVTARLLVVVGTVRLSWSRPVVVVALVVVAALARAVVLAAGWSGAAVLCRWPPA
jgi:hypothetical protein